MTGWDDLVVAGVARRKVPLSGLTTYKLGGPAELLVEADGAHVLDQVAAVLRAEPTPVLVLGRGSNLLVADEGFAGVVVTLGDSFKAIEIGSDGVVVAGAGAPLPRLARTASAAGCGGLEWGVGVPGSTGGAVRQNAGCFGAEVVDSLVDVDVMDLATGIRQTRLAGELDLAYRQSNLVATELVTTARFATGEVDPRAASEEMRTITRWRRDHQPGGTLNAGSVFKNPPGEAAAAIIDRLGLKGYSVAGVRVSPRHANFIEADASASAASVHRLILEVAERVAAETGIVLAPEIQFVGFD